MTKRLQRCWLQAAVNGTTIDIQGDLMRFTADAIGRLAIGSEFNTLE
ncbi:MAG: hypothetical protein LH632_10210 [Rhodoferax sp.]|nr:hypothetical protein [Rhodoferax sp.]